MPAARPESALDPNCPFCREKVKIGATICPHCRSNLADHAGFQAEQRAKGDIKGLMAIVSLIFLLALGGFIIYLVVTF